MASSGITGTATTITGGTTGPLGEVTSMSGPSASVTDIDITNMASTFKEFTAGLPDWGEVTIGLLYETVGAKNLDGRVGQPAEEWEVVLGGTAEKATFSGYIKGLGLEVPLDDVITQEITIKVTSAVVFS